MLLGNAHERERNLLHNRGVFLDGAWNRWYSGQKRQPDWCRFAGNCRSENVLK